ncbi:MAG TPA: hypothetical protein VEL31_16520 [Ktedonobacteraceae bacterium]|nr:hypothetical protein [Ktedonobacteraceae bacterium]
MSAFYLQLISLPGSIKLVMEVLDGISLVLAVWLFVIVWRGVTPAPALFVHGVVFIVERPMHQAVMLDTLVVPLGSLVKLVVRYLFNQRSAYAAWRFLWTVK